MTIRSASVEAARTFINPHVEFTLTQWHFPLGVVQTWVSAESTVDVSPYVLYRGADLTWFPRQNLYHMVVQVRQSKRTEVDLNWLIDWVGLCRACQSEVLALAAYANLLSTSDAPGGCKLHTHTWCLTKWYLAQGISVHRDHYMQECVLLIDDIQGWQEKLFIHSVRLSVIHASIIHKETIPRWCTAMWLEISVAEGRGCLNVTRWTDPTPVHYIDVYITLMCLMWFHPTL